MPRPKRDIRATADETVTPPDALPSSQMISLVKQASGNNLYQVELPSSQTLTVELAARFRSTIWLKRGSYVLVDTSSLAERDNKIGGEIVNVVRDEKSWRKKSWWPAEFPKQNSFADESDEDSNVGRMPPSDSENEA